MRVNAKGEKYNETQEAMATLAESLGWVVDDSKLYHHGLTFNHGNIHVWKSTYNGLHWRKCEYIHGCAANHQSFNTCEEALRSGFAEDPTEGLGATKYTKGQRITILADRKQNPMKNMEWEDTYTEAVVEWAFGENSQFIHVLCDDGTEHTVNQYDIK